MTAPVLDLSFAHRWMAEILPARPLILPPRHFIYPREAEEIERGALEVFIKHHPLDGDIRSEAFLATCALGFRDPVVPTGIWSMPDAEKICAVSGGYAYIIDTKNPQRFTMISYRPVLTVRAVPECKRLVFVGHHAIQAWGPDGQAWQSDKLSDEGVTITAISAGILHGRGWEMMSDQETAFAIDLRSGIRAN